MLLLMLTAAACRARGLAAARSISRRRVHLRAGSTKTLDALREELDKNNIDALIIRTIPNTKNKINKNYSNTNPPYFSEKAVKYLVEIGIQHLLIDLPSIDKEKDGGSLIAHKLFWQFPKNIRHGCTITEFIYASYQIKDVKYLLNLQFVPFDNDASPSRPVLFKLEEK